jgi:methylphosphotriester-DNA--protein-cysteine methyltransferase
VRRVFFDLFALNPKELSRAVRMKAVLHNLNASRDGANAALQHGYYDQSHSIYDFHRLIGTTPERFVRAPALIGGALVVHGNL